jgi:hypothetical protein
MIEDTCLEAGWFDIGLKVLEEPEGFDQVRKISRAVGSLTMPRLLVRIDAAGGLEVNQV